MWSLRSALSILCVCVSLAHSSIHDKYKGYSVYRVQASDEMQMEMLTEVGAEMDVDFWQRGTTSTPARLMLSPMQRDALLPILTEYQITYQLEIEDVASQLKKEDDELAAYKSSRTNRKLFDLYPSYEEVNEYMEDLATRHPDKVILETIGDSFEGRPIKYVKVSTNGFTDPRKPIMFMDAMIHAREWVTTPTVLYALDRLLDNPTADDAWLLDNIDWLVLPIVNPDGYVFSHTDDRMWRRTRSENSFIDTIHLGVDANRNFDVAWNTTGVSQDPNSQTYPGGAPFSEPETRYVRDLLHEHLDRLYCYMNIHSHGNYVLYAFGTGENPDDAMTVHFVGAAMGAAMDTVKLPQAGYYLVGNSARMLYATSGSAQDYAAKVGVPLSYTLEMPGYGYGFQVPPAFIDHMNMETWLGLAEVARLTKMLYDKNQSIP